MGAFASRTALALVALAALAGPTVHAEPFAYFTQRAAGKVQVVDLATHTLVRSIDLANPIDVAVAPGGDRAYVLGAAVVPFIPPGAPYPTVTPAYVAVIDTASYAVVGRVDLTIDPAHVAVSADGARLFVTGVKTCYFVCTAEVPGTQMWSLDTRTLTGALVKAWPGPSANTDIVAHPSLDRVYASDANGSVYVPDASAYSWGVRQIPVAGEVDALALSPSGARLFTANRTANTVSVIDTVTEQVVATVAVGTHPTSVVVHPSGDSFLVTSDGLVQRFDAASLTLTGSVAVDGAKGVAITPDGRLAYVARPNTGFGSAMLSLPDLAPVADIAGGAPPADGVFMGVASQEQTPDILTGLWWNPAQSGWGMHLTQRGNTVFGAWFTYDQNGAPKWYVAPSCRFEVALPCATCVEDKLCAGELRETHGPAFFTGPFDPANVRSTAVGFLQIRFRDHSHASISYAVDGQLGTGQIERQVFREPATVPGVNYTDLWFDPLESGWGMGLAQQADNIFVAWYVYNDIGQPMWYVASNCAVKADGNGCTGDLYRTLASPGPSSGLPFDPSRVTVAKAGRIDVTFNGKNNAYIAYEVDGRSGAKYLVRQVF